MIWAVLSSLGQGIAWRVSDRCLCYTSLAFLRVQQAPELAPWFVDGRRPVGTLPVLIRGDESARQDTLLPLAALRPRPPPRAPCPPSQSPFSPLLHWLKPTRSVGHEQPCLVMFFSSLAPNCHGDALASCLVHCLVESR